MFRRLLITAVFLGFSLLGTGCSGLFYQPDHLYHYPPEQLGLKPHEVQFKSQDGTLLYGWFFPAVKWDDTKSRKPLGTVMQFHGNAENMSSHYLSLVWLTQHGYNFFTFDYRGYGKSQGDPDQKGVYEDALAALDQAYELHQKSGAKTFAVVGQSLGGAISLRALSDWPKLGSLNLLVMDSTFLSYKRVAQRILAHHWFTWIISPLPYVLVSDGYSAEPALKKWQRPLIVVHDKRDPVIPFASGQQIYDEAGCPKELWPLDHGWHIGSFEDRMTRDRLIATLKKLSH